MRAIPEELIALISGKLIYHYRLKFYAFFYGFFRLYMKFIEKEEAQPLRWNSMNFSLMIIFLPEFCEL